MTSTTASIYEMHEKLTIDNTLVFKATETATVTKRKNSNITMRPVDVLKKRFTINPVDEVSINAYGNSVAALFILARDMKFVFGTLILIWKHIMLTSECKTDYNLNKFLLFAKWLLDSENTA